MTVVLASACSPVTGEITPEIARESVSQDRNEIYQHGPAKEKLTLEDVLARALHHNLDAQVVALDELIAADDLTLEMLNSLPSVSGKAQRVGRDNTGGSSSFSVATGTESLQASISSEQYRTTKALNLEWNLLEAGISIGRGLSASDRVLIAQERRRKIYHNIMQDTHIAFWRTAVAQSSLPTIENLLERSETELGTLEEKIRQGLVPLAEAQDGKSRLLDQRQQLHRMKQNLVLADIELKTLIDYPLDQPIMLDLKGHDWTTSKHLPALESDLDSLVETAFQNRPEIREEILNKRISERDLKLSLLEMFPGIEIILGFNRDSNKYLVHNSWVDGIVGLTHSINKIITTPARYSRAKNTVELAHRRKLALVAAIMTQVHVAKARYDVLTEAYTDNVRADENAQSVLKRARDYESTGLMSSSSALNAEMEAALSSVSRTIAFTEVKDAYGRLVNTLGVDFWTSAGDVKTSLPELKKAEPVDLSGKTMLQAAREAGGLPR